jgi:hypothetical protein
LRMILNHFYNFSDSEVLFFSETSFANVWGYQWHYQRKLQHSPDCLPAVKRQR